MEGGQEGAGTTRPLLRVPVIGRDGRPYTARDSRAYRRTMTHKRTLTALAVAVGIGLAACSSGGTTTQQATTATTGTEHAGSIRAVMATRYYGTQLDCVVRVVAERYNADDWTWIVTHASGDTKMPPYFRDLKRTTDTVLVNECGVDGATLSTVEDDGTVVAGKQSP